MKKALILIIITTTVTLCPAKETVSDTAMAQRFHPSFVRVEYTLKSDKADNPEISGWGKRCPNCGEIHSIGDGSEFIRQERPLEVAGFVVAADKILTPDMMIHPRFVKKIEVRYQDTVVPVKPAAYALDEGSVFLQLEKTISGIQPIKFEKSEEKSFKAITYSEQNGLWTTNITKMSSTFSARDQGDSFLSGPSCCLVTDANGTAVGISMTGVLSLDRSWQTSPLNWSMMPAEEMNKKLSNFKDIANKGLLRVKLDFRSPRKNENTFYHRFSDDNEDATELNVAGVILDPTHVLILANLQSKTTGRLEKITVFPEDGEQIRASFAGTLKDYGALTATLEKPIQNAAISLNSDPIIGFERKTLFIAEVRIQGENITIYAGHSRIGSFDIGWRKQLEPTLPLYSLHGRYLFDMDGKLLAFPMARRKKIQNEEDRWMDDDVHYVAACYLKPTLLTLNDHLDENNIPLSEEEENRIAWLGVELQTLDEELARINKVSSLTNDGEIGAMVSFIYADSPASDAGLEMGDILLRFHIENIPRPLDVDLDDMYGGFMEMFPWEQLSELPEEYFDQLPTPWPSVENQLIRTLTDIGFGTAFKAEVFRNGKVIEKDFVITQSPPHYNSAKQYKSELLGLTVRNMTYEVNRYFRLNPEDPGVIISKVLPGSKASVSGIKPYEIITHINNVPVNDTEELKKLIDSSSELKLSVKRMTKGRVVNIRIDTKTSSLSNEQANPATESNNTEEEMVEIE